MNIVPSKRKKLARELLRENRRGRSWRVIAKQDYDNMISFATLNRIAVSKGDWLPKEERLLIVLGLMQIRKPKPAPRIIPELEKRVRKIIAVMAKQTRVDLGLRK